jgi:hypothetical protein
VNNLKVLINIENNTIEMLDLVLVDRIYEGTIQEAFKADTVMSGAVRYMHEVGDVIILLESKEISEFLSTTSGVAKMNEKVPESRGWP